MSKKKKHDECMEKQCPNLFKNGVEIDEQILKCTETLIRKLQRQACIEVLSKVNIEVKALPKKLVEYLDSQFNNGLFGSVGCRPLKFKDLYGDVMQQIEEAIKVAKEYAEEYATKK